MEMYRLISTCLIVFGITACSGESANESGEGDPLLSAPTPTTVPAPISTPEPIPTTLPEQAPPSTPEPAPPILPEQPAPPSPTEPRQNSPIAATCSALLFQTSGCNDLSLTDEAALVAKSPDLSVTTDEDGDTIFHFSKEQSMTLKNEGCYQLGGGNDTFSIAFWLKTKAWKDGLKVYHIMGNREEFGPEGQGFYVQVVAHDNGLGRLDIHSTSESGARVIAKSEAFATGEWVHFVLTYNGSRRQFRIHTNTKETTGKAAANISNPNRGLMIGGNTPLQPENFQISQLTFYTDPLSQVQVERLFRRNAKIALPTTPLESIIASLNQHINGELTLTNEEITQLTDDFLNNSAIILDDEKYITDTLGLIENFDTTMGALFTTPKTRKGFVRADSADGFTLERSIFRIQQAAHDQLFTGPVLSNSACRSVLNGKAFETAKFFPGVLAATPDTSTQHEINIDATLDRYQGMEIAFATEPARRPTGKYVAPGTFAKVTVPPSMVNAGFSILVGAHSIDHGDKAKILRFDRVVSQFPITNTETYVGNPFGGSIYINVPYLSQLGLQTIKIENAVQAPFYSTKPENRTTLAQWQAYRQSPAPWADFETDNFMMQVPTNWIYEMENPQTLMETWEAVMDGMTELKGMTPEQRNRKVLYVQVDVRMGSAGHHGIGYPQVNNTYKPEVDAQGRSQHHLLTRPGASSTMLHELTHAEAIFGFGGSEAEAIAYFPAAYIRSEKLGMDLNEAIKDGWQQGMDEAALNWMVTPNFRNGREMDRSGAFSDETRYQRRGFMKHVDIARLFGWQAIKDFYKEMNTNADNNLGNTIEGLSATDSLMFSYSKHAGADLRPLFHFWGRHPENQGALANKLAEHNLFPSAEVREHLEYYKTIAPENNSEFQDHFERIYPGKPVNPGDYGVTMYNDLSANYDESYNTQIKEVIDEIIQLYY